MHPLGARHNGRGWGGFKKTSSWVGGRGARHTVINSMNLYRHAPKRNQLRSSARYFHIFTSFFFFFVFLSFFRVVSMAHGGSQTGDLIGAVATATAMPDLSRDCDLHHSSWQCRILNPLGEVRDQTYNLVVPSRICSHCAMTETPTSFFLLK